VYADDTGTWKIVPPKLEEEALIIMRTYLPSKQSWVLHGIRAWCAGPLIAFLWITAGAARAQTGSTWQVETVDDGKGDNVGMYASLAIDRRGGMHIAYYDETQRSLRYAFRASEGKPWSVMEVDKPGGTFVSVAVDALGHPHFAYNSPFETGLHYAFWDGTKWHRILLDGEATDHFLSLQLDAKGNAHISYYRELYADRRYALYLKYARFDGETWYVETVDRRFHSGKFNSIALDASGNAQIAYSQVEAGDLRYAVWDGSHWKFGIADSRRVHNSYVGIGNSIALDSDGNMCIAYFDTTKRTVKYAWQKAGTWQSEVVDQLLGEWAFNDRLSMKLDRNNRAHIAYYDHGLGAAKYAMRDENGWHIEVVENQGHVGGYSSLALDQADEPYIAFYDMTESQLRLAKRESHASLPPSRAKEGKP
jgi:hypothetical protein